MTRDDEGYRAGSDIVTNLHFGNRSDVLGDLPRAALIGLFAPFPNMWFAQGLLVGKTGRLLSGAEMLLTYVLTTLAVIGVWRRRTQLSAWLLASTAILGATSALVDDGFSARSPNRRHAWTSGLGRVLRDG